MQCKICNSTQFKILVEGYGGHNIIQCTDCKSSYDYNTDNALITESRITLIKGIVPAIVASGLTAYIIGAIPKKRELNSSESRNLVGAVIVSGFVGLVATLLQNN